jgi:hypothetical protein
MDLLILQLLPFTGNDSNDNEPLKPLKGPKHEIFEIEFFTQIRPVRIDDLGTGEKN